jgi:uncharacterized protein YndB with AHSA1/START domain
MTKTIRQTVTLGATPKRVYEALIDEKRHARFTGAPAAISRKAGGAFTCHGGHLTGFTIDLVPGKRIVQAWRVKGWPKGTFSVVTFALARKRGGKTKVSFTHDAVPASSAAHLAAGWRTHYWKPLKAYLEK